LEFEKSDSAERFAAYLYHVFARDQQLRLKVIVGSDILTFHCD